MENKLQQLTEKLYSEGLSKGRAQGEAILAEARSQADSIIAQARAEAQKIIEQAQQQASDLDAGTKGELRLASTQLTSALHSQIERMITASITSNAVAQAWNNGDFVKQLALEATSRFNPTAGEGVVISVPEHMVDQIKAAVSEKFNAGVDVVADGRLKTPFRIAPADGGYYISFTEADFNNLFRSYVRPVVAEMLFGKE